MAIDLRTKRRRGKPSTRPMVYDLERPWERQPCDTERRWFGFVVFRELVPPRTLGACHARLAELDPSGRWNLKAIHGWSSQDGWFDRVAAYDRWLDQERVASVSELLNEDARDRASRHVGLLRDMQELASRACREILQDARSGQRLRWAPREIARVVKEAITLERLVFGEVTERTQTDVGFDLSRLSIDEIQELRMLEAKAGVAD